VAVQEVRLDNSDTEPADNCNISMQMGMLIIIYRLAGFYLVGEKSEGNIGT